MLVMSARPQRKNESGCAAREESYDEAYVLPNSWKSALVPFLARIKTVGWWGRCDTEY